MDAIEMSIDVGRQALMVTFMLAAPMLLTGLLIGVIISIIQAATQVQEQTLSFIPKIMGMMAALFVFLPWMLRTVTEFARSLIASLPGMLQ